MLTKHQQIYNWLEVAIQQPANRLQELFYFDKREKEFFSILITDYFLFDEKFNVEEDVTSSYSPLNLEKLGEKMIRIENESPEIIAVPRLGIFQSDQEMEYLLPRIDSFLNLNAIDIEDASIWIPAEDGTITMDLTDKKVDTKKRAWWKFW